MATINNSDLKKELIAGAKIQVAVESPPTALAEKVVPTMEVNPDLLRKSTLIKADELVTTGGLVLYASSTNPTGKKTFITCIDARMVKDATCDRATGSIIVQLSPKGKAQEDTIIIPILTLTAQEHSSPVYFAHPLELEPNTNITFTGTYTAGLMSRSISVYGYQLED